MSEFCHLALWITGGVVVLCLLALPFWLLGIPGVENSFAKGWAIGFYTLGAYPIAWLCVFVSWLIARKLVSAEHLPVLQQWIGAGSLVILALAAAMMFYAFRVMSR
ncbi:MAG TPA: hypothetical protein VNP98_07605 [Chthoniobacterales bacterium]|nr:hypothetical protein [Chthoniobacterales bacterium]